MDDELSSLVAKWVGGGGGITAGAIGWMLIKKLMERLERLDRRIASLRERMAAVESREPVIDIDRFTPRPHRGGREDDNGNGDS